MLEPFQLVQGSLALLAFVLAFFTLVARERKTPYTAAFVYTTLYLTLLCIALSILSKLPWFGCTASSVLLALGHLTLLWALGSALVRLLTIQNRDRNLRDDHIIRNMRVVRRFRGRSKNKVNAQYDHGAGALSDVALTALAEAQIAPLEKLIKIRDTNRPFSSISLLLKTTDRVRARELLLSAAIEFLAAGGAVQFTTAIRHPADFVLLLKEKWDQSSHSKNKAWSEVQSHVIVVDAHTPHFGFIDSIHLVFTQRIKEVAQVTCITSAPTFAGIHTAAATAYNALKTALLAKTSRPPTLVVYEGLYALTDLESPEQYRIFCRHVIPSEKLWGRMVTLFVESNPDAASLVALCDGVDLVVDGTPTH